jgi:hypothetical protein
MKSEVTTAMFVKKLADWFAEHQAPVFNRIHLQRKTIWSVEVPS